MARAAMLEIERYDLEVDLRGMLDGPDWAATSTVTFRCREPGASTFVDCDAEVTRATLNGVELDPATASDGRLPLPDLRADNVLVVSSRQTDTASGHGIQRWIPLRRIYIHMRFQNPSSRQTSQVRVRSWYPTTALDANLEM